MESHLLVAGTPEKHFLNSEFPWCSGFWANEIPEFLEAFLRLFLEAESSVALELSRAILENIRAKPQSKGLK